MSVVVPLRTRPKVLEFFAGVGLARLGLEQAGFQVVWSNDFEPAKHAMYAAHFQDGAEHPYVLGDVGQLSGRDIPKGTQMAWASSPCTDLSLAGARSGLAGHGSSAFWLWVDLLRDMAEEAPGVVVLENVTGLATSHGGDDLRAAIRGLNELGYSIDLLALDARRFLPQSRPRLFLVGAKHPPESTAGSSELRPDWTANFYGDDRLIMHRAPLPNPPPFRTAGLSQLIEEISLDDERWWDDERTTSFLRSLSPMQRERVAVFRRSSTVKYRTAYRRTRQGVAVWEVRADDVSGCLRTARGGSSKQAVVRMGNKRLQVRWMTPLEYARLMGAADFHLEGARVNQALFGFGDAVAVPAVEWLAKEYLYPLVVGKLVSSAPTAVRRNAG